MNYSKVAVKTYLLRLMKGEEITETIKNFCKKEKIQNGSLQGIGSVEDITLAHYRVDTKKYSEKKFVGIYEVTSLVGNIALFENQPLIHAHITLSDATMRAYGGHLVSGAVSATLEIVMHVFNTRHIKSFNKKIGLKLWDLPEESKK